METNRNSGNEPEKNKKNPGKERKGDSTDPQANDDKKANLEPDHDKDYKVLHKDGSLAAINKGTEDRGALEGSVGLGM